jgi:hypothetical protein
MPQPVSQTANQTQESQNWLRASLRMIGPSQFRVLTVTRPPSGMASRAFNTRFKIICCACQIDLHQTQILA